MSPQNPIKPDGPLFPMRLCIYDLPGGKYAPVEIASEEVLHSEKIVVRVGSAMVRGHKIVMEDCNELCVFHAEDGKILFPTQDQVKEIR